MTPTLVRLAATCAALGISLAIAGCSAATPAPAGRGMGNRSTDHRAGRHPGNRAGASTGGHHQEHIPDFDFGDVRGQPVRHCEGGVLLHVLQSNRLDMGPGRMESGATSTRPSLQYLVHQHEISAGQTTLSRPTRPDTPSARWARIGPPDPFRYTAAARVSAPRAPVSEGRFRPSARRNGS